MTVELKKGYIIDSYYDKHTRSYITTIKDNEGNQVGDASYSGNMTDRDADVQYFKELFNDKERWKKFESGDYYEDDEINDREFLSDTEDDTSFEESLSSKIRETKKKTKKAKLPALSTLSPIMPDGAAGIATFNSGVGLSEEYLNREELIRRISKMGFKYKFDKYSDEALYRIYQERLRELECRKKVKREKKQKADELENKRVNSQDSYFENGIEFESEDAAKEYFGESMENNELKGLEKILEEIAPKIFGSTCDIEFTEIDATNTIIFTIYCRAAEILYGKDYEASTYTRRLSQKLRQQLPGWSVTFWGFCGSNKYLHKDAFEFRIRKQKAKKSLQNNSIEVNESMDNKIYLNDMHRAWQLNEGWTSNELYDKWGDDPESLRIEEVGPGYFTVFSHDGNSTYYFGNSKEDCIDWCEDNGEKYFIYNEIYESKQSNHKNILNESLKSKRNEVKHNFRTITEGLKYFERKEFDENYKDAELELLYEGVKNNLDQDDIKKLGNFLKKADSADDVATFIKGLLSEDMNYDTSGNYDSDGDAYNTHYMPPEDEWDAYFSSDYYEDGDAHLDESAKSCDGWIAIYNGNRVEIPKSDANGIYEAKQIAIKKLKVPKSKVGLLAIKPGYNESLSESYGLSSPSVDDILDWLSNHDIAWEDCQRHFGLDFDNDADVSNLDISSLEGWISEHDGLWSDYCRYFGLDEDAHLNEDINRYSDVVPYEKRKYWYFTTHGIGPGTIPKDLHVLEVREGQNDKGTWGDFICLDGVLNTSELRKYDLRELAPPNNLVESLGRVKKNLNESYIEEWWGQVEDDPYELENYGLRVIEKDRRADEVLYRFEGRKSDIERAMDDGYFYSFDLGEDAGHSSDLDKTWGKIVDELIEVLHTVGFQLDSSVSQPVRDNVIEGKHLQVINPSLMFPIDEAEGDEEHAYDLMIDDLKDVTYVLEKFEEDNDVSITFSFGPNKDNVITGGIDVRSSVRHS